MKYLKKYEEINKDRPKVGDYVICTSFYNKTPEILEFLSNNVGEVLSSTYQGLFHYQIKYDNIPRKLITNYFNGDDYRFVDDDEIIYWSSDREDLEAILKSKKFNI